MPAAGALRAVLGPAWGAAEDAALAGRGAVPAPAALAAGRPAAAACLRLQQLDGTEVKRFRLHMIADECARGHLHVIGNHEQEKFTLCP